MKPHTLSVMATALTAAIAIAQQNIPATDITPTQPAAEAPARPAGAPLYDEKADAAEQIAAALATAKRQNQRVLIQWGGNWCGWCIKLDELFRTNSQIARKLQYEYVVVHVDAGKPPGKNVDLAARYDADVKRHGYPFLTVLSAEGKPLANQETGSLEVDGKEIGKGHDPQKVMAFLTRHQSEAQDAKKSLDAALEIARKDDKRIFLHFGAPWCGWCHKLEAWMLQPEVAAILGRDFVPLKIDIDRMTGGKDLMARLRGSQGGGIPWFAFLDSSGKPLITSDPGGGGNIGFPAKDDEIAHFEKMLRETAKKISADDIAKLSSSLREQAKPAANAR